MTQVAPEGTFGGPLFAGISPGQELEIQNLGASTVYYDQTPIVNAARNEGSILAGATATLSFSVYLTSVSGAEVKLRIINPTPQEVVSLSGEITKEEARLKGSIENAAARLSNLESLVSALQGQVKPVVTTEAATGATSTSVTFHATVTPYGTSEHPTAVIFEYGPKLELTATVGQLTGSTAQAVSITVTGTFTALTEFRAKATNSAGSVEGAILTVGTITAEPIAYNPGNQQGTVGALASLQMTGANVTKWSAKNLPAGLSINTSTGLISGTYETSASYLTEVTGEGTGGKTNIAGFTWAVTAAAASSVIPVITPSSGLTPVALTVNGAPFVFKGPTIWGIQDKITTQFGVEQYSNREKIVQTIAGSPWKANCIRLRILFQSYNAETYMSKSAYVQQVKNWVELAAQYKLYTFICAWDALDGAFPGASWATHAGEVNPLFEAIYKAVGSNPYCLWEPFNEPNGVTWEQWQANFKTTIAFFRETLGYKGLLLLNPLSWANSGATGAGYSNAEYEAIEAYDAARTGMAGKHALAFAKHDYANNAGYTAGAWNPSGWEAGIGGAQIKHLICESEFGHYNGSEASVFPAWSLAITEFLKTYPAKNSVFIGSMPFLWGPWYDKNGITLADNVTPTSPWGEDVKKYFEGGTALPSAPVLSVNATDGQTVEWAEQSGVKSWTIAISLEPAKLGRPTAYVVQGATTGMQKFEPEPNVTYGALEAHPITPLPGKKVYVGVAAAEPTAGPYSTPEAEPLMPTVNSTVIVGVNTEGSFEAASKAIILLGVNGDRMQYEKGGSTNLKFGYTFAKSKAFGFIPARSVVILEWEYHKNLKGLVSKYLEQVKGQIDAAVTAGIGFVEYGNELWAAEAGSDIERSLAYGEILWQILKYVDEKSYTSKVKVLADAQYGKRWLEGLTAANAGIKTRLDGFSYHTYGSLTSGHQNSLSSLVAFQKEAESQGYTTAAQNFYITETGWNVTGKFNVEGECETFAQQATYLHEMLSQFKLKSWVKGVWYFDLLDGGEGKWGCVDSSNKPRESGVVLGEYARGVLS